MYSKFELGNKIKTQHEKSTLRKQNKAMQRSGRYGVQVGVQWLG